MEWLDFEDFDYEMDSDVGSMIFEECSEKRQEEEYEFVLDLEFDIIFYIVFF